MLILVTGEEYWDDELEKFVYPESFELEFEHSLASIFKWEEKFKKPFLGMDEKTDEEVGEYLKCMLIRPELSVDELLKLPEQTLQEFQKRIEQNYTATWFNDLVPEAQSSEIITAELVYFWMTMFSIPFEAQEWHLSRLFALIRIANIKNSKPKKMSRTEIYERNKRLNAQRRKDMGSNG